MNRAIVLLIVLATTSPLHAQQEYGSKPGLEYRAIRCLGDEDDLDLHVVRIDLDRWDLDTAIVDRATGRMIASSHDAAFDINANFFDKSRNPLGAVIRDGDVVNPPRDSSWQSIFLIDDGGTPRIVMPKKWPSYRAGVCIRNHGDLVFFATPLSRRLHITEIAKVATRDDVDGGLACRDAVLFDGGHSVNFYAEGDDRRISVEGDPVPVHIFATPHSGHDDAQTK